jgi:flagellar biosynthesis protein FlhB
MNWSNAKYNFVKILLVLSGVVFVYYIAITINFKSHMNGIDNSYLSVSTPVIKIRMDCAVISLTRLNINCFTN